MSAVTVPLVYFGKIPSRGDFVRSHQQGALTHTLDRWLTQGIELMAANARWKEVYDRTQPLHFAFLGVNSRVALAGHLLASADTSGRRFPFVAAAGFDVASPEDFIMRSPMVLARPGNDSERAARHAHATADADPMLAELAQAEVSLETAPRAYDAICRDFTETQSIGSLQALLVQAGHRVDVRRTLLALGLLLQPLPASRSTQLDKGLRLPLPADPLYQSHVATWWIELVTRFLRHADFEMAMFVSRGAAGSGPAAQAPTLLLGFSGGSPAVLHAALDPQTGDQVFVDLRDADWAEAHALQEYALKKLSSYLHQPALSLRQAQTTFCEAFLGE